MKKFFEEFKAFISKGNVLDMAVGVIIGAAFKSIVDSLVADIISPLLGLFEQMKKERYMFTEPVDGHWDGHITRDNVDRFKHPVHVTPGSRLERLTGKQTILGASMHNYRITHPARSLTVAGRTDDGTIEALEYGEQMLGVQFHPEADDQNDDLFRAIL